MTFNSLKYAELFYVGYFIWSLNGPISYRIDEEQAQRGYLGKEKMAECRARSQVF